MNSAAYNLSATHRALAWQLVRFGIAGFALTGLQVALYNILVDLAGTAPQLANAAATAVILVVAYAAHSRFSFRDVGTRDDLRRTGGRFAVAHFVGWVLNAGWVWLLVDMARLPASAASAPMLTLTPLMLFVLKRFWVFR